MCASNISAHSNPDQGRGKGNAYVHVLFTMFDDGVGRRVGQPPMAVERMSLERIVLVMCASDNREHADNILLSYHIIPRWNSMSKDMILYYYIYYINN